MNITEVPAGLEFKAAGGESEDGEQRVEVAELDGEYFVRDSLKPEGPILRFNQGEWDAFVLGVQAGEFDV